jgi:photosystem II stability/assembly factor-like uncharacterized protein
MLSLIALLILNGYFFFASSEWIKVTVPDSSVTYVSAKWVSDTICIMAGNRFEYGIVVKSIDAGLTWSTVLTGVDPIFDIAASGSRIIAVADTGTVYSSIDSGATWDSSVSLSASLYGVSIGTNGIAFAVGVSAFPVQAVTFTSDSSYTTWTSGVSDLASISQLNGVCSYDGVTVVAIGNGGAVLLSTDAGLHWSTSSLPTTSASTSDLYSIDCSSTLVIIAGTSSEILFSSDNGVSWTSRTDLVLAADLAGITTADSFMLHSVSISTTGTIMAASSSGAIILSSSEGSSWSYDGTCSGTLFGVSLSSLYSAVAGSGSTIFVRVAGTV